MLHMERHPVCLFYITFFYLLVNYYENNSVKNRALNQDPTMFLELLGYSYWFASSKRIVSLLIRWKGVGSVMLNVVPGHHKHSGCFMRNVEDE